jgi:hypothetical protein
VQGIAPQFRVIPPLAGLKSAHRLVYSYDNVNWQYFNNGSLSGGYYNFSNNSAFTQNQVYVAIMPQYPTSKTDAFVASVKNNPCVHPTVSSDSNLAIGHTPGTAGGNYYGQPYYDELGRTVPSLPLYGFKVTDGAATGPKTKIILPAGTHRGEPLSQYVLEGMVSWLTGGSCEAAALRRAAEFYVYPSTDPEGRYMGYYVSGPVNPNGNHNRMWGDGSGVGNPMYNPELVIVENAMRADTNSSVTYFLDMHVDWNDSMMYGTNETLGSDFYKYLKVRDPAYCAQSRLLDVVGRYAQGWAELPASQGGLGAAYTCTPEFGQIYNNSTAFLNQRGVNFGLAFYDALVPPPGPGDFNIDSVVDMADVNMLWGVRGATVPPTDVKFDLVKDGLINLADARYLVENIIGTSMADTNLDHTVDILDLGNLANKYDQAGGFGDGDTDANGTIDVIDLGNLANDYGESFPRPAGPGAVPEPITSALLIVGCAATVLRRRPDTNTHQSPTILGTIAGTASN